MLAEFAHLQAIEPGKSELSMPMLSHPEQHIFNLLTHEEMQQDEIIRRSELPAAQVSVALLQLEMKKLIEQHPVRLFTRTR